MAAKDEVDSRSDEYGLFSSDSEYDWQKVSGSPRKIQRVLEVRRQELLENISTNPSTDEEKQMLKEWIILVKERDSVFRKVYDKENRHDLDKEMHELLSVLERVRRLKRCHQTESTLTESMSSLHNEVVKYLRTQRLGEQRGSPPIGGDLSKPPNHPLPDLIAAPPPPPPPPVATLSKPQIGKVDKMPVLHSTPRNVLYEDLHRRVRKGKCLLKKTPGMRSPGGTPRRKAPRYDFSDNGSIISRALKTKFRNVSALSPKVEESTPTKDDSLTISIDRNFSFY